MNRRELLRCGVGVLGSGLALRTACSTPERLPPVARPTVLRIRSVNAELAPGINVPALTCNDLLEGPALVVVPDGCVAIDILNEADRTVRLRSSGIAQDLRLAAGERVQSAYRATSAGNGYARSLTEDGPFDFVAGVAGRFAPPDSSNAADQVHHLSIQHWLPSLTPGAGAMLGPGITYRYATLGGKLVGANEPIRVREGELIRFRFFNASPTKCVTLSLPYHRFRVLALDGHAVPRPWAVKHVFMGPGERVEATVDMNNPGRFVLGSIDRRDRDAGFGRLVEYVQARGPVMRGDIEPSSWAYAEFASRQPLNEQDVTVIPVQFGPAEPGAARVDVHRLTLNAGRRYRLSMLNATGECHCVGLRGHSFELVSVAGITAPGVVKDTIALPPFARSEIEFVAVHCAAELLHDARFEVAAIGATGRYLQAVWQNTPSLS